MRDGEFLKSQQCILIVAPTHDIVLVASSDKTLPQRTLHLPQRLTCQFFSPWLLAQVLQGSSLCSPPSSSQHSVVVYWPTTPSTQAISAPISTGTPGQF